MLEVESKSEMTVQIRRRKHLGVECFSVCSVIVLFDLRITILYYCITVSVHSIQCNVLARMGIGKLQPVGKKWLLKIEIWGAERRVL
jgi:hypothetical protein